jgi:hypothetical protein
MIVPNFNRQDSARGCRRSRDIGRQFKQKILARFYSRWSLVLFSSSVACGMNVTVRGKTQQQRTVTFDARAITSGSSNSGCCRTNSKSSATQNFRETAAAIRDMVVRGAGAIGATAAYGLAQGARAFRGRDRKKFSRHLDTVYTTLKNAHAHGR